MCDYFQINGQHAPCKTQPAKWFYLQQFIHWLQHVFRGGDSDVSSMKAPPLACGTPSQETSFTTEPRVLKFSLAFLKIVIEKTKEIFSLRGTLRVTLTVPHHASHIHSALVISPGARLALQIKTICSQ